MDLQSVFSSVSKRMIADLEEARVSISHPGMKGDSSEEIVIEFLRKYLPKNLDICTGILVDSKGSQSKQLDIIITDAAKTPIFYEKGKNRVIPVECAYSVIEVKSVLTKEEIGRCYENMLSVKELEKSAYFVPNGPITHTQTLYGREWAYWPTNYFVFGFESRSIESVRRNIEHLQLKQSVHMRIDSACILDRGVLFNIEQSGALSALPTSSSTLAGREMKSGLLFFYVLLSAIINQASMNPFNMTPYISNIDFMSVV